MAKKPTKGTEQHFSKFLRRFLGWLFLLAVILSLPLRAEDRLWMDGEVNGHSVRLLFDTGASHTFLYSKTAERLGLKYAPSSGQAASPGEVLMRVAEECNFVLAGNTYRMKFGIYGLPDYTRTKADGVLGWGSIRHGIILIDAGSHEISPLAEVPDKAKLWKQFKLETDAPILSLEIPRNGSTNTILLDTGSEGGLSLAPEKWREWKVAHSTQRLTVTAMFLPANGLFVEEEAWADKVEIGALTLADVPISGTAIAKVSSPSCEATLGLKAMEQLQIVVDGKNGIAYVNVKSQSPTPYQHNRLGAVFVPNDPQKDGDLVAHVATASPAQKAGIQDKDVLLKIDKLDVTKWRTDPAVLPLTRFWKQPAGTEYRLTLRRGQQTNEVTVRLEDILGPRLSTKF